MESKFGSLRNLKELQYSVISLAGLSFWFFLGFPFGNQNESYLWLVQLNQYGLLDLLSNGHLNVANFRPLGVVTAWLGYEVSGGAIYLQQLFNYLGALLAWLILFSAIKEKRLFSWVSLIVGGGFFSGYIYLFHLHGVFYSPLLMFVAFLLARAITESGIKARGLAIVSALAVFTSLYHPFAILIYIAYMAGCFLENLRSVTQKQLIAGSLLTVAAFGLVEVLVPNQGSLVSINNISGLFVSYKLVELSPVLSVASWLLSITTVFSLNTTWQVKVNLCSIVTALSLVFVWLNWPVVIVWILVSLFKAALIKKWTIAFLIIATAILPIITGTGSPTYTVFALLTCCCVLPVGWSFFEKDSIIYDRMALVPLVLAILVVALLKADVHIPTISGLVRPVLAEKEKTFQMEDVIRWIISSEYRDYRLVLCQSAGDPVTSTNSIQRTQRAPTSQRYLDAYIDSLGIRSHKDDNRQLMVCFGSEKIENSAIVYAVAGKYNGEAIVWSQSK